MSCSALPTQAISADFGRQAVTALFAAVFIGNNVTPTMDIARGDADHVIHKGFALAERIMQIKRF